MDVGLAAFGPASGVWIVDASGASGAVRVYYTVTEIGEGKPVALPGVFIA